MDYNLPEKIDLHMHTIASDGTDSPEELIEKVRSAGLEVFSVTDHDTVESAQVIPHILYDRKSSKDKEPSAGEKELQFIPGIEFSCRDEAGKYHVLGYGYDAASEVMLTVVRKAHNIRIEKVYSRLDFLRKEFGFVFSDEDIEGLLHNSNPGKPHIARLMIRYGYASTIKDAMQNYLNKKKFPNAYLKPQEAIDTILQSGGIPVLAHPSFGDGDQLITGEEMKIRLQRLKSFGLEGVECYYSGFSPKLIAEMLDFAEQFDFYVTAGSDYHGTSKLVQLGDTNLDMVSHGSKRIRSFLEAVCKT